MTLFSTCIKEKLKEELENAPLKRPVLKDKVIWYAEPELRKPLTLLIIDTRAERAPRIRK